MISSRRHFLKTSFIGSVALSSPSLRTSTCATYEPFPTNELLTLKAIARTITSSALPNVKSQFRQLLAVFNSPVLTSLGVNPQVTILAVATKTAEHIVSTL